jgi:hypothetical protein
LPSSRIANLPLDFLKGESFMRYTVTMFKVRLEVCDVGDRTGASDDVIRVARPIFAELDASVCARLETRSSCNVTGFLSGSAIISPMYIS